MSRDPVGYNADINLYAYVGNNPLNFVDPLGLEKNDKSLMEVIDDFLFPPAVAEEATDPSPPDPVANGQRKFDKFMEFVRNQAVERRAKDPFVHEKIADKWERLPESVRNYEPEGNYARYVDDRGNHPINQRLPGGYHLSADDPGHEGVYVHQDAHNPIDGRIATLRHFIEVRSVKQSVYQDKNPDYKE